MKTLLKTAARVLLSWQFILNLLVILLITCWVPLLSQTVEMLAPSASSLRTSSRRRRSSRSALSCTISSTFFITSTARRMRASVVAASDSEITPHFSFILLSFNAAWYVESTI